MALEHTVLHVPDDETEIANAIAMQEVAGWTYNDKVQVLVNKRRFNRDFQVVEWDLQFSREVEEPV